MRVLSIGLAAVMCVAMLFVAAPVAKADDEASKLIVYYDFDGDFDDDLDGSTLTPFGTENDGSNHNNATSAFGDSGGSGDTTYWQWTSTLDRGGGFIIDVDDLNILENYSVGVRFVYDDISVGSSWDKIIDYKDQASDNGFYFYDSKLQFYPGSITGATTFSAGTVLDVIATRDAATGKFIAYTVENGTRVKQIDYDDLVDRYAIPAEVNGKVRFGFFHDDTSTSSEATSGGKVYSVKIWNGPITEEQATGAMETPTKLSFDGNGETGGSAPSDIIENEGVDVTIPGENTLEKTGHDFDGWNTADNGSGIDYAQGSTYTMPADDDALYAKWSKANYAITYELDGGTNNAANPAAYTMDDAVTFADPEKDGHTFGGWFTDAACTAGNETTGIAAGSTGDVTIYAKWAGTPASTPAPSVQYGSITLEVVDGDKKPMANCTVELHSKVVTEVTDASGKVTFANVPLVDHTLVIKDSGNRELGRVALNMTQGTSNEASSAGSAIDVVFDETAVSVDILDQLDDGEIGVEEVEVNRNPATGGGLPVWIIGAVSAAALLAAAWLVIRHRRSVPA